MGLEMQEVAVAAAPAAAAAAAAAAREQQGVEIYPLSRYYFGARDAAVPRALETAADRALRLRANFAAHGLRTSVHGVLLVELFDHPHLLLLQLRNSYFLLPGGRLRPGEQDVQGLKRKLSSKLSFVADPVAADALDVDDDWQVGECIGMWWRSEFGGVPFPYLPNNFRAPKECIKLFLVRLPMSRQFVVPRNMKLLAVPLSQIHGNAQVHLGHEKLMTLQIKRERDRLETQEVFHYVFSLFWLVSQLLAAVAGRIILEVYIVHKSRT